MKTIFNGKIVDEKEAVIPISDKGYFYDFAVYSSLKVIGGKCFFPNYHVERLFDSAKKLDLNHPFTGTNVSKWIQMVISENGLTDALLRIILIGDADKNDTPDNNAKFFIFPVTGVTFYPNSLYTNGAKVITYKAERRLPEVKSKDLLLGFMATREAKKADAIEALLVDTDGNIREGTRSNFYAVRGSTIILPPKKKVLEGIVSKIIQQLAQGAFTVVEEDIPLRNVILSTTKDRDSSPPAQNDNRVYDEFFLSSTLFNIMPIGQIDDYVVKSSFPITKQIMKLYKEYYRKEVLA